MTSEEMVDKVFEVQEFLKKDCTPNEIGSIGIALYVMLFHANMLYQGRTPTAEEMAQRAYDATLYAAKNWIVTTEPAKASEPGANC